MASRNTTQTHKYVRRCHTQEKRCADTFHHGAHLIFLSVQTIVAVSGCVCVFVYKWLKPKEPKNAAVTATMDGVVVVDVFVVVEGVVAVIDVVAVAVVLFFSYQ